MSSNIYFNEQQKKAIETIKGPVLIIAGAGSGKTGVITNRIAHMLKNGVSSKNILALTFTNKAADEMENRVKNLIHKSTKGLQISTFHAFGVRIIREQLEPIGLRHGFTIYDSSDKISCLKEAAIELKAEYEWAELNAIATFFSKIKCGMSSWAEGTASLKPLYKEYNEHLNLYNAVDFDDLIALPTKLFEERPEILEKYQNKFTYIMVDEFQDTSLNQYRLIDLLAGRERNICCVGDDDQSIYSWRGANYHNIELFEKSFPERIEIKLERNYRSTGTILKAANAIIANNKNRKEKELWTQAKEGEREINTLYPENEKEEAEFIATKIRSLKVGRGIDYHNFGILVRTNSLTRSIEEALLSQNIPYSMTGGTSFFARQEIKDIIGYLKVIANPDDNVNLLRIINTPRRGVGKKALERLNQTASENRCSLYSAIAILAFEPTKESARTDLDEFYGLIEEYRARFNRKGKLSEKTKELVEDINYWGYLLLEFKENDKVAKWRYENINYFIELIDRWESDPDNLDPTLYNWLNRITLITRDDNDDLKEGKANLMTIHASKGLEFDTVFLAGTEEGILPHARSVEEREGDVEEERRLFYVAVTRAKRELFITSCRTRQIRQEKIESAPSSFLKEIPLYLVKDEEKESDVKESMEKAIEAFGNMPWKQESEL